jgi:hypothetical protein
MTARTNPENTLTAKHAKNAKKDLLIPWVPESHAWAARESSVPALSPKPQNVAPFALFAALAVRYLD